MPAKQIQTHLQGKLSDLQNPSGFSLLSSYFMLKKDVVISEALFLDLLKKIGFLCIYFSLSILNLKRGNAIEQCHVLIRVGVCGGGGIPRIHKGDLE